MLPNNEHSTFFVLYTSESSQTDKTAPPFFISYTGCKFVTRQENNQKGFSLLSIQPVIHDDGHLGLNMLH